MSRCGYRTCRTGVLLSLLFVLHNWGSIGVSIVRADTCTARISENVAVTMSTDGETITVDTTTATASELSIKEQNQLSRLFLKLHTELYRIKLLPRRGVFSGMATLDNGTRVVDKCFPRDSIDVFLANVSHVIPAGARCLEWGEYYSKRIEQCTERWKFNYEATNPHVDFENKVIHAMIDAPLPKEIHEAVAGTFDAVLCTQVYEHIRYPHVASKVLSALLKGGGHLLWSAPFFEPRHLVPQDHFRYTLDAGQRLFQDVGLQIVQGFLGGDAYLTSARILGYTKLDIGQVNPEALNSILIDSRDYLSRRVPPPQDLYWGSYILARKPGAMNNDGSV